MKGGYCKFLNIIIGDIQIGRFIYFIVPFRMSILNRLQKKGGSTRLIFGLDVKSFLFIYFKSYYFVNSTESVFVLKKIL